MEDERVFDPGSDVDIFVLHLVFLPIIQRHLDESVCSWNRHGIRTAHLLSSHVRLFHRGISNLKTIVHKASSTTIGFRKRMIENEEK